MKSDEEQILLETKSKTKETELPSLENILSGKYINFNFNFFYLF